MPHQCLKCEKIYDNTSDVIIRGCPNCGSKLFLYIKRVPVVEEEPKITKEQKELILKEAEEFVSEDVEGKPIIFKLENVRVLDKGKYEIDINQLLKKEKPLIYRVEDGTYVIDLNYLRGAYDGS